MTGSHRPYPPGTGGTGPVLAIDIDGVLNPAHPPTAARLGYRPYRYDGPDPTGGQATGTVWLHPDHGGWLRELADRGADLVWCTSWRHLAASWIAPRLGLPTGLPVICLPPGGGGVRWGHQVKLGPLYTFTGRRPVAVLDDEIGGKDPHDAERRTREGIPTLLVRVDRHTGLRRTDIDRVATWLDSPRHTQS